MANGIPDDVETKYLGDFAAALRTHDEETVAQLSKSEAVFYISEVLGVDMDEDHPSEHNGNVTTATVRAWARKLAEREDEGEDEGDN